MMYPIHDVDATLLLALSLASKRRPAELVDILAAARLKQGTIPPAAKLIDAFYRLSAYGLICAVEGGYTLAEDAQIITGGQRRNADADRRIHDIKENLADYIPSGEHPVILLTEQDIESALLAYRTEMGRPGGNLLTPKPKPAANANKPPLRRNSPSSGKRRYQG